MLDFGATFLPDPPSQRFVELVVRAEELGFTHAWTYDSHILWEEGYIYLTLAVSATSRIHLGHCVTNPGIREPTVTASAYATLQQLSEGRMALGIGRGDSFYFGSGTVRNPLWTERRRASCRGGLTVR